MSVETIRTLFSPIISGHTLDLGEYEVLGRGLAEYHNTEVSNQRRLKHNLGSITAMPRNIKCIGFFFFIIIFFSWPWHNQVIPLNDCLIFYNTNEEIRCQNQYFRSNLLHLNAFRVFENWIAVKYNYTSIPKEMNKLVKAIRPSKRPNQNQILVACFGRTTELYFYTKIQEYAIPTHRYL